MQTQSFANETIEINVDPVSLSKQIIQEQPKPWSANEYAALIGDYDRTKEIRAMDKNYLLLQSPWLGMEYLQGVFVNGERTVPVEQLLDLLNQATNSPELTSKKLAEVTLQQSLSEYAIAYDIAKKLSDSNTLSYEDAVAFLSTRYGYQKIKSAKKLLSESGVSAAAVIDKKTSKRISAHLKNIRRQYSAQIPIPNALKEVEIFYNLLEEVAAGLAAVPSYTNFTQTITELNDEQIQTRKKWRSSIEITNPVSTTVWTIPDLVDLEWISNNMPADKTIKFYLTKDNMVVQELGTFKNNQFAKDIRLNKALPAGDTYKIMGIELFPANKFHTAKFATSYFTINKRRPGEIPVPKEEVVQVEEIVEKDSEPEVIVEPTEEPVVVVEPEVEEIPEEEPVEVIEEVQPPIEETVAPVSEITPEVVQEPIVIEAPKEVVKRTNFDGRKITYVKELEVNNKIIHINIWDHGRQDDDIVSIYLNGIEIVSKYSLTYHKKGFELNLDMDKPNDLFLYAHNLGRFPPNTVSIEVIDGENTENIILNSDLSRCEAVLINVRK
ncbi:MAG: hypothetical protein HKM92_05505 [Arenibacter sp.]|nr:hypothetical protein [Arenibacter sp.]